MRALWRRHGLRGIGVAEGDFEHLAQEVTGLGPALRRFFDTALRSTRELPLKGLLATHGIDMLLRPAESSGDKGGKKAADEAAALARRPALGVRTRAEGRDLVVTHVLDGAAQAAGLAAGDVIVAVDGVRMSGSTRCSTTQGG
jgi:predicted metalloprotease with PDZ domain